MVPFLDTCVIYGNYDFTNRFQKKIHNYLSKEEIYLISDFQIQEEIPKLIERKIIFSRELFKKTVNPSCKVHQFSKLNKSEKIEFKSMLIKYANYELTQNDIIELKRQHQFITRNIQKFLKKKNIKSVIPKNTIREEIVQDLFIMNQNKADSKIITSGIQENQKNELILLTLDKKDWKKEHLKIVCDKHKLKRPKLQYIQDC